MATKGQLKSANKFVEQIQRSQSIHKFDLMDMIGISIATYNQLKPYIEYRFGHNVGYDPKTKMWTAKKVVEIES